MAIQRYPTVNGLVALAGGGQPGATRLRTQAFSRVTTVATAADSVMAPQAINGSSFVVVNAAAANSMNMFPESGNNFNALAADAAFAVAANKTVLGFCVIDGTWNLVLTA